MPVFHSDALDGEKVIVTGATGGIGSSTAEVVARMGADLLLTGRDEDRLSEIRRTVSSQTECGGTVVTQPADLTEPSDRLAILQAAESELDGATMVVNAAGISDERRPFKDLDEMQLTEVMEVNYMATVLFTRAVYEELKNQERGAIVNITSLSGLRGTYQSIPYCSSKFALTGFTESLALEAIEHGIRVNAVSPGWVDTPMARAGIKSKAKTKGRSYEQQLEVELDRLPSGKLTEPEEVANTVTFLLTDAAENIVGESIKISGGSVL